MTALTEKVQNTLHEYGVHFEVVDGNLKLTGKVNALPVKLINRLSVVKQQLISDMQAANEPTYLTPEQIAKAQLNHHDMQMLRLIDAMAATQPVIRVKQVFDVLINKYHVGYANALSSYNQLKIVGAIATNDINTEVQVGNWQPLPQPQPSPDCLHNGDLKGWLFG